MDLESHFWSDLVPTWVHLDSPNPPKVRPSWSQNRSKLGCWFETCFLKVVVWIFIHFCSQHNMAEGTISSALSSNYELFCFLVVVMLGWFFDWIFVDFWSILESKIDENSFQNRSKRRSKTRCKLRWSLDGSWIDFGGFWSQVGSQVGAKLDQKSIKKGMQNDMQKNII